MLIVNWAADLRNRDAGWIELQHQRSGEPAGAPYRLGLIRDRVGRWMFADLVIGRRAYRLYLPRGASQFASWRDHGMRHPSDSDSLRQRPVRHLQRLQARLAALLIDHEHETAGAAKIADLQAKIAEAELKVWLSAAARMRPET